MRFLLHNIEINSFAYQQVVGHNQADDIVCISWKSFSSVLAVLFDKQLNGKIGSRWPRKSDRTNLTLLSTSDDDADDDDDKIQLHFQITIQS